MKKHNYTLEELKNLSTQGYLYITETGILIKDEINYSTDDIVIENEICKMEFDEDGEI